MVAMNHSPFYQQFHWQLMPQQLGNAAAPSPAVVMYLFPQTIGIRRPNEELRERNLKRQIRNRESAARSRAKKLAYVQSLEEKTRLLEEEKRKLIQQQECNTTKLLVVSKEAMKSQLRRANSATF